MQATKEETDKIDDLWDYVAARFGTAKASGVIKNLRLNNVHVLKLHSLENWKLLIDKISVVSKHLNLK